MITIEVNNSNKCNDDYSLYISFPYNQQIVDIMRNQAIRYWHPDIKKWELPLKSFNNLKEELKNYELNISDSQNLLSNSDFIRFLK